MASFPTAMVLENDKIDEIIGLKIDIYINEERERAHKPSYLFKHPSHVA